MPITEENIVTVSGMGFFFTFIILLLILGQWDEIKANQEMKRRRQMVRRGCTNFARIQAVMAMGNGTIKGGK